MTSSRQSCDHSITDKIYIGLLPSLSFETLRNYFKSRVKYPILWLSMHPYNNINIIEILIDFGSKIKTNIKNKKSLIAKKIKASFIALEFLSSWKRGDACLQMLMIRVCVFMNWLLLKWRTITHILHSLLEGRVRLPFLLPNSFYFQRIFLLQVYSNILDTLP